ncbi:MAG TPA: acyltransferase domain-containing protein, partial [Polyangiaceae bacterium]|nr:acyltransferase domain-containing protein [Polyangiaceae bacterium]
PTVKVRAPNPKLAIDETPFYLNTEARPWVSDGALPRRASVSALGFGGTNFHVALEEYVGPSERPARLHTFPSELVVLGAATPAALAAACRDAASACAREGSLVHLAKRTQLGFDAASPARVSVVANDEADAREKLAAAAESIEKSAQSGSTSFVSPRGITYGFGAPEGDVAFLFPGQGSQYVGMGAELAMRFDCAREVWDHAADAVRGDDGPLTARVYPAPVFTDEARASLEKRLTATEWAQPAIMATSLATLRLLERLGLRPAVVGGHSLGEITAGVAAGVFEESAGLAVARRRGELMAKASETAEAGGAMTAAASDPATVARVIEGIDVVLANHNAPRQVVLSGAVDAIERAERALEAAQITARRLPVATAFHSPMVEPSVPPFTAFLAGVPGAAPRVPYYANATAAPYSADRAVVCAELAAAIARPVRFVEQIDAMYAAGIRTFVEVGPDSVLTRLVERCLEGRPHAAVATDQRGKHGVTALLHALGRLSTAGVPVTFAALWEREALPEDLAAKPAAKF